MRFRRLVAVAGVTALFVAGQSIAAFANWEAENKSNFGVTQYFRVYFNYKSDCFDNAGYQLTSAHFHWERDRKDRGVSYFKNRLYAFGRTCRGLFFEDGDLWTGDPCFCDSAGGWSTAGYSNPVDWPYIDNAAASIGARLNGSLKGTVRNLDNGDIMGSLCSDVGLIGPEPGCS